MRGAGWCEHIWRWNARGDQGLSDEDGGGLQHLYYTEHLVLSKRKGSGRITPAAAALGTLLRLKPVLQIQGEKLDAYAKSRTLKAAKATMLEAVRNDCAQRFGSNEAADKVPFTSLIPEPT
ncbi:MAG: DegV family protein [Lachnospiraceae bacterium]